MKFLNDYRCVTCGEVFEELAEMSHEVRCKCGSKATRLISPVRTHLDALSGDFPGAAMKWAKEHEKAAKKGN